MPLNIINALRLRTQFVCSLAALTLSAAFLSPLSAAVVVTNSASGFLNNAATDSPFSHTVQNSNSVLVIGFYIDTDTDVTSVSFGGVAASNFFEAGANSRTYLAYWNNPATGSGDLTLGGTFSGGGGVDLLVGAYELAGVDMGATVTSSVGTTITTPTDNEFVISFAGRNGNGDITPGASSIIDTNLFTLDSIDISDAGGSGGGGSVGGGAGLAGLTGSQNVSWSTNDGVASYSFQAIPEPSAALLGGLGALMLLRRRRA